MDGSKFIEVFGHIIFSFTRSVSEQYSPNYEDSEYSQETSEYSLLQNTGREWYAQPVDEIIYQEYSDKERLWRITHPAYSYVMMAPLYGATAVMFRVMQVDLGNLKAIACVGIIHGVAEVIERSTVVVIDHICLRMLKRTSVPWGRYRTPRTERITADITIMSMLYESTAIVSINGFFHLYQFIYMKNISHWAVLLSFTKLTTVPLAIEWLFASMSLAIETRYQNLAVISVWRKDWRRHILVAVLNVLPLAVWTSQSIFTLVQARFKDPLHQVSCKIPFS
ncbi:uncharacterized protein [Montipora foliosa]|uniref:uncharacterized protein n=1 Tax=Montipora foliosa TaxID=591990 RepID=UPI0035F1F515